MEDRAANCAFVIRYANKPLELEKSKGAVEVGSKDKLPSVINILVDFICIQGFCFFERMIAVAVRRQWPEEIRET